jgi:hypothetical protein
VSCHTDDLPFDPPQDAVGQDDVVPIQLRTAVEADRADTGFELAGLEGKHLTAERTSRRALVAQACQPCSAVLGRPREHLEAWHLTVAGIPTAQQQRQPLSTVVDQIEPESDAGAFVVDAYRNSRVVDRTDPERPVPATRLQQLRERVVLATSARDTHELMPNTRAFEQAVERYLDGRMLERAEVLRHDRQCERIGLEERLDPSDERFGGIGSRPRRMDDPLRNSWNNTPNWLTSVSSTRAP